MIYLDNSATTFVYDEVLDEINDIYKNYNFNPSSAYDAAMTTEKKLKNARQIVAKSINADTSEIYFTSGGTEANNTAILGISRANRNKGNHIITSAIEHDSIYNVFKYLQEKENFDVTYIKPNEYGLIDSEELKKHIRKDTILVSIMHVNNEIGSLNDISKLSKVAKSVNDKLYFHTDCVQSYMKTIIDVKNMNVDLISVSAHKIHSTKGTGFLYVKNNTKIIPLLYGGGQENAFRSGTENVAGIVGMSKAVELQMNLEKTEHIKDVRDYLKTSIEEKISNIRVNTPENSAVHILSVSFEGIKSEILLHYLETEKIYVSSGSACSSKKKNSRVLENIGLDQKYKDSTIRFSLSFENTKEQMDFVVEKLQKYVEEIRKITKYRR